MFLNIGEVFDSKAKTAGLIKSEIKSNKKNSKKLGQRLLCYVHTTE